MFSCVSIPVGAALSGVLFRDYGFYGVYGVSTALYLFCLVYVLLAVKKNERAAPAEKPKKAGVRETDGRRTRAVTDFFDLKHVRDAFRVTFRRHGDDGGRTVVHIVLLLVVVVILVGPLSGRYAR